MAIRTFLKIDEADGNTIRIKERFDFRTNAFKNRIWYRGEADELHQLYKQVEDPLCSFWNASPSVGREIRKIHTGLPGEIIDTLTGIIARDLNDIELEDAQQRDLWDDIEDENNLSEVLEKAIREILIVGDGAFKVSLDGEVSDYPIIEFFPGDRVKFVRKRGRIREVDFHTDFSEESHSFTLVEKYGYGYVRYELLRDGNPANLDMAKATAGLVDVAFDDSFMMAVPYIWRQSEKWDGRGKSLLDGKIDAFDSLDEAYSQWIHAMRESRPMKYIPEDVIPRDEKSGTLLAPNPFDTQFVSIPMMMGETSKNEIGVIQPEFLADRYDTTYKTALDMALQGIISPSTLGIDVKKLDNAESQREKEKTTLYTRGAIIQTLTPALQKLVEVALCSYYTANQMPLQEVSCSITFGEYANPSFEAVVETMSNPNTPMSIEAKVDEMWGSTKDEEWKAEEIRRIKEQIGVVSEEEPALAQQIGF
ncbi:MAG: capsid protein [Clostridiales bacterium]|nr:capsid protein [Candidatus Cacconaster stercorequi]